MARKPKTRKYTITMMPTYKPKKEDSSSSTNNLVWEQQRGVTMIMGYPRPPKPKAKPNKQKEK